MPTQTLFPDEAYVSIAKQGSADTDFTTDIDSLEEGGFEREIETRPFFHGAKVVIKKPQADGEITLNAKITRLEWDQMLHGGTGSDFQSGGTQNPYRITWLITKDSTVTSATGSLSSLYDHYRKIYANAYLTSFNPKLEAEGMLEGEVTFTVAPLDENKSPNIRTQINIASTGSGFNAVGSYTSSVKW